MATGSARPMISAWQAPRNIKPKNTATLLRRYGTAAVLAALVVASHLPATLAQEAGSDSRDAQSTAHMQPLEVAAMSLQVPPGLVAGSPRSEAPPDQDPSKTGTSVSAAATPGWTTILFEDAEGSFPSGNGWNTYDANASSGEDYWDDLSCRSYTGSWSVWSADIGDQADCVNYDNNMNSWMIFGPFTLADASDARAEFRVWSETERPDIPYDYFFWGASTNGTNFYGYRLTSDVSWGLGELDLTSVPTLGDLTGASNVWFGFAFVSDSTVNSYEGTYVDDILIEKLASSQVDLVANDIYFRDQPQNAGNIITDPTPADILYPHFSYTVNSPQSVSGKIWEIEINNSLLCSYTGTVSPGARVGWCNSPISLQAGIHSLHGEVDPDGTIAETNGNNNDAYRNYTVDSPPGSFTLSNEPPVCDTQPPGPSPAVRLNWSTSSGATSYDIYRNGSFYSGGHAGTTYYNSSNVVAGQTYSYFIRAQSPSGTTDSNTISVSIPSDICAPDIRIEPLTLGFSAQSTSSLQSAEADHLILLKNRRFTPAAAAAGSLGAKQTGGHLLIQFADEPDGKTVAALAAAGVRVLHAIPRRTLVASVPPHADLSNVPGIRWIGTLRPEDKISGRLAEDLSDDLVVVDFFPDIGREEAEALLAAAGGDLVPNPYLRPNSVLARVEPGSMDVLAAADEVSWIRAASGAEISGEELFQCPGGLTSFGSAPNFVLHDDGWDGPGQGTAYDLRYHFDNGTSDISGSLEQAEVERAFAEWEQHAAVAYTETSSTSQNRSMDISWVTGDHGDGYPFDGPGMTLAHNFYPSPPNSETIAGDMHFDDDELWRIGSGAGYDIFTIALHEAGHGLGLGHSDDPAAVMYPTVSSSTIFTGLNADDIAGIQQIYAVAGGGTSFSVFNDGETTLNVTSISLESSAPWISWSPTTAFSVATGGSMEVTVSVDIDSAPAGQSQSRLLVVSDDPDESPYPNGVYVIVDKPACFALSRTHTGSGSDPLASPSSSIGCPSGQYQAGATLSLVASPSSGWQVGSWSGTNNDSSTSTSNALTMPSSAHSVQVSYEVIPSLCYALTLTKTGSGLVPTASPASSTGCSSGEYVAGEVVQLVASPAAGWSVSAWSGTDNDASTATTNTVTMTSSPRVAGVIYEQVTCSAGAQDLVLQDDSLLSAQTYEACNSITAGPSFVIYGPNGHAILRAPKVILRGGFAVSVGGRLTISSESP